MIDSDDLEPLLTPRPAPGLRPGFDAALFTRTERALARGRRLRRLGRAAAVAGVFAVGWVAGWGVRPDSAVQQVTPAVLRLKGVTVPVVGSLPLPAGSGRRCD